MLMNLSMTASNRLSSRARSAGEWQAEFLLQFFLKQRQGAPRKSCALSRISIEAASSGQVPHDAVGMVHRLAACMVHILARIVLEVSLV